MNLSKASLNVLNKFRNADSFPIEEIEKLPEHERIFVFIRLLQRIGMNNCVFELAVKTNGFDFGSLKLSAKKVEWIASRLPQI